MSVLMTEGTKGSWLVTQFLSKGMDDRRELILAALDSAYRPAGIMERSEATVRRLEGPGITAARL
jgi:23S rRNA (cytosine1962-C5)-methyltransferase